GLRARWSRLTAARRRGGASDMDATGPSRQPDFALLSARPRLLRAYLRGARQGEIKVAAGSHLALHPDHAAVGLDDALRDGQAESDPAPVGGHRLPELPKNVRDLVGWNARTVVLHGKPDAPVNWLGTHED